MNGRVLILRELISFQPFTVQSEWLYQKASVSASQKTLAEQQKGGPILWERRLLTWHFSVVWRRMERDFCKQSWLLQINSSSLSETTGVAFEPHKTRVPPPHLTSENRALPSNPNRERRIQTSPSKSPSWLSYRPSAVKKKVEKERKKILKSS